jgi:hypothetical protein
VGKKAWTRRANLINRVNVLYFGCDTRARTHTNNWHGKKLRNKSEQIAQVLELSLITQAPI